eukprot:5896587-Prymnesium_polylepis.1
MATVAEGELVAGEPAMAAMAAMAEMAAMAARAAMAAMAARPARAERRRRGGVSPAATKPSRGGRCMVAGVHRAINSQGARCEPRRTGHKSQSEVTVPGSSHNMLYTLRPDIMPPVCPTADGD